MKTKHYLTSADVEILVDAALQYATAHSFNVSIAVVDDGGTLLMMKRMDGASVLSTEICQEKAKSAAVSRRATKVSEDMIRDGKVGFLTINAAKGMLEGGEPIVYQAQLVGAVGISGVQSFQDAEIAQYAIQQFLEQQT
ncbi:heme-binding protein [Acinetobacter colistiniresistens]|uniref:GlcG/HbpS family heme-binding protein n=1 Tax=Acinetobacter colistiniresistens TaxID=280145 RepID=UPI00211C4B92|nr:heme-binding protein [Acinetobacter colistiniresistens]UUM29105.1 heme-binding protein [Acinetobacter colistiniresistens]